MDGDTQQLGQLRHLLIGQLRNRITCPDGAGAGVVFGSDLLSQPDETRHIMRYVIHSSRLVSLVAQTQTCSVSNKEDKERKEKMRRMWHLIKRFKPQV